jgi:hypothetical protein
LQDDALRAVDPGGAPLFERVDRPGDASSGRGAARLGQRTPRQHLPQGQRHGRSHRAGAGHRHPRALHRIAEDNARSFAVAAPKATPIVVRCADARTVELPPGDTVLHLYHPFGPPILTDVLANVGRSLAQSPRRIRVAYLAAFQEALDVLDATPFLRCKRFVRCVDNKYSWALYESC